MVTFSQKKTWTLTDFFRKGVMKLSFATVIQLVARSIFSVNAGILASLSKLQPASTAYH